MSVVARVAILAGMAIADQRPPCISGDAIFAVDDHLRVQTWNRAVERFTGVPESDAVGRPCWQLLGGACADGSITCHVNCSHARLALGGWPVRCFDADIRAGKGRRRATFSTIVVRDAGRPLLIHLLRDAAADTSPQDPPQQDDTPEGKRLTRRQLEVFDLMGEGAAARVISRRLGVTEATVRNHIRAILVELRCNSQLAAVARGRALGLIR